MIVVTTIPRLLCRFACVMAVLLLGCGRGPAVGEVSGAVRVDGEVPAAGSSITFIPTDSKSPTAGAVIESGRYSAQVPIGIAKVEIRIPRPRGGGGQKAGPGSGPGGGGFIEESLPAKYNDQTELTLDVTRGKLVKDWELSTK
jgi:hypothetical protein